MTFLMYELQPSTIVTRIHTIDRIGIKLTVHEIIIQDTVEHVSKSYVSV